MKSGFLQGPKGIGETRYKQITVCTQRGHIKSLEVAPTDSIQGLKATVASSTNVPEHLFTLTYKGEPLEEGSSFAKYDIPDGESLVMVTKPPVANATADSMPDAAGEFAQCTPVENIISVPEAKNSTQLRLRQRLAAKELEKRCRDTDEISTCLPSDSDPVAPKAVVKSNSVKRRGRHQRTKARLAAIATLAPSESQCSNRILEGSVLIATMPGPIYASSKSWEVIGEVPANTELIASGPLEMACGHVMVPVKPQGAVEWRILTYADIDSDALVSCAASGEHDDPNSCFTVVVQTAKGFKKEMKVSSRASVASLKETVSEVTHVPLSRMNLTFGGEELNEDKLMSECGIGANSVLTLSQI